MPLTSCSNYIPDHMRELHVWLFGSRRALHCRHVHTDLCPAWVYKAHLPLQCMQHCERRISLLT